MYISTTEELLSYSGTSLSRTVTEQAVLSYTARCPQFMGFQYIEVYGDTQYIRSGLFELSVLSQASAVEGYPLSRVPQ